MFKNFLLVILASFVLFTGTAVHAKNPLQNATNRLNSALGNTGLSSNIETSIGTVIKGLLSLVGTVFLILTVYAGILWMTAQGNSEKVDKAKGIITTAVIGLFVIMAAYAITAFVTGKLGDVAESTNVTPPACSATCVQGSCPSPLSDNGEMCQAGFVCCSN